MKIIKSVIVAVGTLLIASCSPDWGEADPPAGNQTKASREVVGTFAFEYSDDKPLFSDVARTFTNKVCEVVEDETLGSNVLHLDSGYVQIPNPLNNVELQDGAAVTMWVNLSSLDLEKAIFSFGYGESDSAKFYLTPNAGIVYSKPGQLESLNIDENNPVNIKTGAMTAGGWHFLALQVADDGYQIYVDGELKANQTQQKASRPTDFRYKTLVDFLNRAPYLYIGAGADMLMSEAWYDDITVIRNHMQKSDWNKKPGSGGGDEKQDNKIYIPVGTPDCSAAWWTEFSDYFTIPAGQTFHTRFINHTSGANNWNNWNLVLATDDIRGGSAYSEYFALRSDLYGWGDANFSIDNITNEGYGDWEAFKQDMEGAVVDLTVERAGAEVKVTATATAKSGNVYKEMYHQTCGDGTQKIRAFLAVDGSYLEIDPEETYVGYSFKSGSNLVGAADCTAAFFGPKSDFYPVESGSSVVFHFINNNTGSGSNWNNWILCGSNVANGEAGYTEYFVLRADAYGWGDSNYNVGNITSGFNWDTFVSDMHGADCFIKAGVTGGEASISTKQRTAEGVVMPAYTYHQTVTGNTGFFLTVEQASLDLMSVGYYPYFDKIFETKE